jgi:hypothetical protein
MMRVRPRERTPSNLPDPKHPARAHLVLENGFSRVPDDKK